MYMPLDMVCARWPRAQPALYVDDLVLKFISTLRQVLQVFPDIVRWFIELVETYLYMISSRGPTGKSSFVTSTEQTKLALLGLMAALSVPPSTSVKWLGVDY